MKFLIIFIFLITLIVPLAVFAKQDSQNKKLSKINLSKEYREQGRYTEALAITKEMNNWLANDPSAKSWQVRDGMVAVNSLEAIVALSDSLQQEMAESDRLYMVLRECREKGEYIRGLELAQKQLQIRIRIVGQWHHDVGISAAEVSYFYYYLGHYDESAKYMKTSTEITLKLFGELHPTYVLSLNNLGLLQFEGGNHFEAEKTFQRTLDLLKQLYPGESYWQEPFTYSVLNNLALTFVANGDYVISQLIFQEILMAEKKLKGFDDKDVLIRMHNLAKQLKLVGDLAPATEILLDAIEIMRAKDSYSKPDLAACLGSLADVYQSAKKFNEAKPLLEEALSIYREVYQKDHENIAMILVSMGDNAYQSKELERALGFYREALDMFVRERGARHFLVAETDEKIGTALLDQGKDVEASHSINHAVSIYEENFSEGNPKLIQGLKTKANLLLYQGKHLEAEALLEDVVSQFEVARLKVELGMGRAAFMNSPYDNLAMVRLLNGDFSGAWEATEKGLGRAFADQLSIEYRKLNTVQNLNVSEADMVPVDSFSLEEIQKKLTPDSAILGLLDRSTMAYNLGSLDRTWAYVMRDSGPVVWVPLFGRGKPETSIYDLVNFKNLVNSIPDAFDNGQEIQIHAQKLYNSILRPLRDALDGVNNVVVLPGGEFHGLPLGCLMTETGRWVGGLMNISYCPSATVFSWLQDQKKVTEFSTEHTTVLFLADPPFSEAQARTMSEERMRNRAKNDQNTGKHDDAMRPDESGHDSLPRLRNSRREVVEAQQYFNSENRLTLLGEDASEENLRHLEDEMWVFDILHFATHALIDNDYPDRCALILSQVDLPDPMATAGTMEEYIDGRLSVAEIFREWNLDADLVVLSGCSTAMGRDVAGEGQVGFAQTILQAGARNLILSLWEVDDEATSILLERFYFHLMASDVSENKVTAVVNPISAALKEAQKDLRGITLRNGSHPFIHPWYWAGFVVVGGSL